MCDDNDQGVNTTGGESRGLSTCLLACNGGSVNDTEYFS